MLEDDLSVYFDDDGEDAVLDGSPVRVIFGAPGDAALPGMGMSSNKPRALVQEACIPPRSAAPDADPVLELPEAATRRPGWPERYVVTETVPDGTGMATLILSKHPTQP